MQNSPQLHELLSHETSFELALAKAHGTPFESADRQDLERALLDAFTSIDREIARMDQEPWINIYRIQEFLFHFWGQRNQGYNAGYLFTLNQDLFFERNLYNEHARGAPGGALPGLAVAAGHRWFRPDLGAYSPQFVMRPLADPPAQGQLRNQMNVIKLHGSFNWYSSDERNVMVVGTDKTAQIASLPLLSWYADIFKHVITAGNARLMIIGYGFGDEHINATIADAIENHGLKVFIWNTIADLRGHVLAAPYGATIWNGLISTAARPLIEVFPSNQAETEEYRRIRDTFFA